MDFKSKALLAIIGAATLISGCGKETPAEQSVSQPAAAAVKEVKLGLVGEHNEE